MEPSLPVAERPRRPEWMKVRAPSADSRYFDVKKLLHGLSLNTVCEEARCPNIAECWGRGTATFQILGDTCTRACRYCYVHSGKPDGPPDALEPLRVGQAAAQMALRARRRHLGRPRRPSRPRRRPLRGDDPRDQGEAARGERRGADARLPRRRRGGAPDRARRATGGLQPQHRDRAAAAPADARREGELRQGALAARAREGGRRLSRPRRSRGSSSASARRTTRSSRRCATCARTASTSSRSASTSSRASRHATIDRWVHPDEFRWLREQGEALGFGSVFAGPLVRSSYRADEQRHAAETGRGAVAY